MVVINDNRENKRDFVFLDKGAVFELNGQFYMKILDTVRGGSICNAVELSKGELSYVDRHSAVIECQNVTIEIN